ncbi:MAG: N-formylglutamate amidohydrolase [Pseudomonadota bacterium]
MSVDSDFAAVKPFEIDMPPVIEAPCVFNSPHSGRHYPERFLRMSRLDESGIRRSEDFYVDELFDGVPLLGAPLMRANFPRSYLDVNREPYELDPRMFSGSLPPFTNRNSIRVAGGLGTVPRVVSEGQNIYPRRLPYDEARNRIEQIYKPYHEALRGVLARIHRRFGCALLIDCHSMPASVKTQDNGTPADFIVGDRFGSSASRDVTAAVVEAIDDLGYSVVTNKPYAGGFITEHYGRPAKHLHALQIEINRGIYFDEKRLRKTSGFDQVKADMNSLARVITDLPIDMLREFSLAAE